MRANKSFSMLMARQWSVEICPAEEN